MRFHEVPDPLSKRLVSPAALFSGVLSDSGPTSPSIWNFTLFEILFGVIQSLPVADDKELSLAIDAPCSGNLSS
jgi:hypothetical protein